MHADDGAGVRPGDQAGHERPFEREIRRVVVRSSRDATPAVSGTPSASANDQAVGPVAALEDQDVAEPAVSDQHGGQRRHDGELHDQRREQHLLGGEKLSGRASLDLLDLIGRVN